MHGIHYILNLTVFGLFGDRWASECGIWVFVRPVDGELEASGTSNVGLGFRVSML